VLSLVRACVRRVYFNSEWLCSYSQFQLAPNPKTPTLFVNDYSVIEGNDLTRRTYTANFAKYIRQRSPYINGYGLQSHVGQYLIPMDVLQSRLD
jgi:GH35 family endo-1,4-beta-xylanase